MTEVPPFLFVLTSTALILGVAITVRGLLGFRPPAETATLPSAVGDGESADASQVDASAPDASVSAITTVDGDGSADDGASEDAASSGGSPVPAGPTGVRDLRESFVMTFVGVFICIFTLLAISALIHSA